MIVVASLALGEALTATGSIAAAGQGLAAVGGGVGPRPFVLAVLFGCSRSYATPMGYQTNLLLMAAADYRCNDFVRTGLPLLVMMWVTLTYMLARTYGLL